jgi:hypothetical protein
MLCPALLLALSQSVGEAPPNPSASATAELRGEALELSGGRRALGLPRRLSSPSSRLARPPRQARCARVGLLLGQVRLRRRLECLSSPCGSLARTAPGAILGDLAESAPPRRSDREHSPARRGSPSRRRVPEEECSRSAGSRARGTHTGDIARAETRSIALEGGAPSDAQGSPRGLARLRPARPPARKAAGSLRTPAQGARFRTDPDRPRPGPRRHGERPRRDAAHGGSEEVLRGLAPDGAHARDRFVRVEVHARVRESGDDRGESGRRDRPVRGRACVARRRRFVHRRGGDPAQPLPGAALPGEPTTSGGRPRTRRPCSTSARGSTTCASS